MPEEISQAFEQVLADYGAQDIETTFEISCAEESE